MHADQQDRAHIGASWNVFFEISNTYPTPLVLEKYSLTTMMITASETLSRIPAEICGKAAGSTIRRIWLARRHAVGTRSLHERRVDPATPSIVFSSTGKKQKNAMKRHLLEIADRVQQDHRDRQQRRRRHRTPVLDVRHREPARPGRQPERDRRARPRAPSPIPKPSRIRSRLGTTSVPNSAKSQRSWNSQRSSAAAESTCCRPLAAHAASQRRSRPGRRSRPRLSAPCAARAHSGSSPLRRVPPKQAMLDRREGEVGREAERSRRQGERVELSREAVRLRVVELAPRARAFP